MITVLEKVLFCSILVTLFGILFGLAYSFIHEKGDEVPFFVACVMSISLFVSPFVALGSVIWIIFTL